MPALRRYGSDGIYICIVILVFSVVYTPQISSINSLVIMIDVVKKLGK